MAGMYDVFETDEDMESGGIWIDYGEFRVKIASAGQGNKKFVAYSERALKPVRKAIQAGALSNERSRVLMSDVYAKTIIIGWQCRQGENDEWVNGIEQRGSDELLEVNYDNIKKTLLALPNLFTDLQEQANSISNFRHEEFEDDAKNS